MNKFGHFLYQHKLILLNIFLAGFIAALDPRYLENLPDDSTFNQNLGLGIFIMLLLEIAGIHYKSRWIHSFPRNLHRKIPVYLNLAFFLRVVISAGLASLVLAAMGALEVSDFFLIPIVIYATLKEFWVRGHLLNSDREPMKRPAKLTMWLSEIGFFLFLCTAYFALWDVYLLEHERIMYKFLSQINWGFSILIILFALLALEMPYFYDEWTRTKKKSLKILSVLSILLPVLAFAFNLYRLNFL